MLHLFRMKKAPIIFGQFFKFPAIVCMPAAAAEGWKISLKGERAARLSFLSPKSHSAHRSNWLNRGLSKRGANIFSEVEKSLWKVKESVAFLFFHQKVTLHTAQIKKIENPKKTFHLSFVPFGKIMSSHLPLLCFTIKL